MNLPRKNYTDRGFIKIALVIVASLVLLKYAYDLDVIGYLTEGRFKELLDKFYSLGQNGWAKYKEVILKVWNTGKTIILQIINKIGEKF